VVQEQAAFALITASTRADTVVVGSRGLGAVKEALLGSTSLQLVAHARCPVVVVREVGEPDADAPVVVGADGSSLSADATGYAFAQAARRGRAVTVLHAWDPRLYSSGLGMGTIVETWNDLEATQQDIVASAVAPWVEAYPDVEVRTHVLPGRPGEVLVDASAHAELVVVGSRGRGGFRGLLLGSVSRNVLLRAHCPVAVVRPQRREGAKD
jgi:nucleotide-binding universal stress UspA family protein